MGSTNRTKRLDATRLERARAWRDKMLAQWHEAKAAHCRAQILGTEMHVRVCTQKLEKARRELSAAQLVVAGIRHKDTWREP